MTETRDSMEPLRSVDDALGRIGQPLGVSSWLAVTQDLVTAFAKITSDEQWIHVDPERARSGPSVRASRMAISLCPSPADASFMRS